eukprot:3069654-Alexandrium_andersonii.AAC.1
MAALAVRFVPDASLPCNTARSCNLGSPADRPSLLRRRRALQDPRRGAHPTGWFSRRQAPGVRTHGPDARVSRHRSSHSEPARVPNPALDLRPRHQVQLAILVPGARHHGVL